MEIDEYTSRDACGLAELIRSGQVSSDEVQQASRDALARVEPHVRGTAAEPFAVPLDHAPDGRFAGVPFGLKDLVCHAAGVPTRMGSRLTGEGGITFDHDTELMTRFRRAGLATVALTTSPEMGYNANTEPVIHGSTRNPWNPERSPGGSSGGSGALVAAGAFPIAHANDGGGSIRIPAAYNGLVGLKPTRGLVSSGPDMQEGLYGFLSEFVVTRTVRDTAAALDEVAGWIPGDKYRWPTPPTPYAEAAQTALRPLRVAVHTESWAGTSVDPEVADGVHAAARKLEDLGHHVEPATPAFDWDEFMLAHYRVWAGFVAESIAAVSQLSGIAPSERTLEASVFAGWEYGRKLTVLEMAEMSAIVNRIIRDTAAFFQRYDVLLTPTTNTPALPLGYLDADDPSLEHEEWTRRIFDVASFTPLHNLTGAPAISLPLAQTRGGLPIGVQFAADLGGESLLLGLAGALEQAMPWADRSPGIHASR